MGDISMEEYGCVAISPLWLGGTEQQNSLFCVHNCPEVQGARELNSDGLMLGGWEAARPKVAAPRTHPNPRLGPTPTLSHTLTPSPRPRPSLTPQPSPPVHPLSRCRAPTPDR